MRTILILASSALAAVTLTTAVASADERINVTPPISREHARALQAQHPASELTVVPQPVPVLPAPRHVTSAAIRFDIADR